MHAARTDIGEAPTGTVERAEARAIRKVELSVRIGKLRLLGQVEVAILRTEREAVRPDVPPSRLRLVIR
jgi:hypothetical protein